MKKVYTCEICNYSNVNRYNFNIHMNSKKHNSNIESENIIISVTDLSCQGCRKAFKTNSGLYRHKKKCKDFIKLQNNTNTNQILYDILYEMKRQRSKKKDITPDVEISNVNTNNVNTNNVINNINFFNTEYRKNLVSQFLNERCGNAMNLLDFCKDINFDYDYHRNVYHPRDQSGNPTNAYIGYVNETSKMLNKKLQEIPIEKRPLHCFPGEDKCQKIYHVRHDNEWKREHEVDVLKSAYQETDDNVIIYKFLLDLREKATNDLEYIINNKNITKDKLTILQNMLARFTNMDISSDINMYVLDNIVKEMENTAQQLKLLDQENITAQIENI